MSGLEPSIVVEDGDSAEEKAGLLQNVVGRPASFRLSTGLSEELGEEDGSQINAASVTKELVAQSRLSGPLSMGLIANYCLSIISLGFVGQLGTQELAAAALGATLYGMSAKMVLMGLCGALDTYASQAVGSGNFEALGLIFQRAVLFLLLHTVPMSGVFLCLPRLLRALGQEEELTQRVGAYLLATLPAVWVDAIYRPLNRVLVAQHITVPQMLIGGAVAVQHIGATYLFVYTWGTGFLGAAYSAVWSNLLATLLLAGYVRAAGLQDRVWGRPSMAVLQGWPSYARLAYSSAAMKCLESWGFNLCTILAGFLPDPDSAVAAMAVAFNLYGVLYMWFAAQSVAASTRVGNALGAGRPRAARLAAAAAALSAPFIWVVVATILVVPASQRLLIRLFTTGVDELLLHRLRDLLYLVVVLEFFDGAQTVMSGVVSGSGKQAHGFVINLISFWVLGVPAALLLGFLAKLGVEGMYGGMILGPVCQCICYGVLIWRLRWDEEAAAARRRVAEASAAI